MLASAASPVFSSPQCSQLKHSHKHSARQASGLAVCNPTLTQQRGRVQYPCHVPQLYKPDTYLVHHPRPALLVLRKSYARHAHKSITTVFISFTVARPVQHTLWLQGITLPSHNTSPQFWFIHAIWVKLILHCCHCLQVCSVLG